jgi:hypothetical protein
MNLTVKAHAGESIYLQLDGGALVRVVVQSPRTGPVSLQIAAPPEVQVLVGEAAERLDAQGCFREGRR